jgi:polyphosphate kinase 2 (PPK2 family)
MPDATRLHRLAPGAVLDLSKLDPADTSAAPGGKEDTRAATVPLATRLGELQDVLWARQQERVLVVLQGIDTSGKGGTVRKVFGAVNPAGLRVTSFNVPTEDELARDYLWRVHARVPANGEIGVFDRSHYEDVLAVRVLGLVPEKQWRRRYDHINDFERLLTDEGTRVVKVFLNLSKDEQRARLQSRLDEPT